VTSHAKIGKRFTELFKKKHWHPFSRHGVYHRVNSELTSEDRWSRVPTGTVVERTASVAVVMLYRNGNVSCIEALIQASSHETNDDDVDGRTPLLLACLNGHHQAVQVLLSLGGDVTKRWENRQSCTLIQLGVGIPINRSRVRLSPTREKLKLLILRWGRRSAPCVTSSYSSKDLFMWDGNPKSY